MSPSPTPSPGSTHIESPGVIPGDQRKRKRTCFTRSRGGCAACRKLKKKCDEAQPKCGRCVSFHRHCEYPTGEMTPSKSVEPSIDPSLDTPSRTTSSEIRTEDRIQERRPLRPLLPYAPPSSGLSGLPSYTAIASRPPVSNTTNNGPAGYPSWMLNAAKDSHTHISGGPEHQGHLNGYGTHPGRDDTASQVSTIVPTLIQPTTDGLRDATNGEAVFNDNFWETFFGPLTQPVVPLPTTSPLTAGSYVRPSSALLSVPLACDSSLWSSFVDSSSWTSRPVSTEGSGTLLEHFSTFASTTMVVRVSPTSASAFFAQLADKATENNQTALMHSVLCVSAIHLSNWAGKVGDTEKALHYAELAADHRSQAIHLLRIASAKQDGFDEELNAATMVLLTLSGILRGDAEVMASFIRRTATMLEKIKTPRQDTLLPAVSALHSLYTGMHAVVSGKQIDINSLFPNKDARHIWEERSQDVLESVVGVRKELFLLYLRVHSLVMEHDTIVAAMRRDPEDEELHMMQIELHSECSTIEAQLRNQVQWNTKFQKGQTERTQIGHECYRVVIHMLVARDIFKKPWDHPRVQLLCADLINWMEKTPAGSEIGLLCPQLIVGSQAKAHLHDRYRGFAQRCMWKGSTPPRVINDIMEQAWMKQSTGEDISWRDLVQERGCPLFV